VTPSTPPWPSPLIWHNRIVADQGAHVTGRVTQVVSAGWFNRPAVIALSLGTARARSGSFPIQTGDLTIKADSNAKRNLLIIGGTAALGAAAGGGAGTLHALSARALKTPPQQFRFS